MDRIHCKTNGNPIVCIKTTLRFVEKPYKTLLKCDSRAKREVGLHRFYCKTNRKWCKLRKRDIKMHPFHCGDRHIWPKMVQKGIQNGFLPFWFSQTVTFLTIMPQYWQNGASWNIAAFFAALFNLFGALFPRLWHSRELQILDFCDIIFGIAPLFLSHSGGSVLPNSWDFAPLVESEKNLAKEILLWNLIGMPHYFRFAPFCRNGASFGAINTWRMGYYFRMGQYIFGGG